MKVAMTDFGLAIVYGIFGIGMVNVFAWVMSQIT